MRVLIKILTGVCSPGFFATIPLATETEGQNHTLGYEKWVKIKPLTIGNITKLTTFEAILHEIGQIWPKFCHLIEKMLELGQNGQNLLTMYPWLRSLSQNATLGYGNLAKNRPLATEIWLKKGTLVAPHDPCESRDFET